ncbi:MAG: glycerol-3-phosphate 1-O-acyltransferase PlsY [Candidatus Marinimicrobia bacterium]|nr:glycerol-3-phosphate 1-O-acyltransferase PlsY [Candidatus Neomarinimicrobiota bacterium]MCF7827858.1 glycerol-3-phosphate 1-O-acyltransferase PlsY [Candidatus Neomarinimicrobiota bacterium]MCF7879387.1 glycerol-3-phosphate 1-O-acyltransferase PlsY [Candidatus Neomarinimicrobiota bacterium]
MIQIVLIIVLSYLVGSIPTSIIVGKVVFGKDVRNYGSGNAGGTNAWRTFGWKAGLFVMLADLGKGVVATLFVSQLPAPDLFSYEAIQLMAGCAAVIGHIWTIFARFNGGKGVGTAAGMLLALYPVATLICIGVFGIVIMLSGYVSLGSLSAALALPIVLWIMDATGWRLVSPTLFYFSIPVVILIYFTHRANIKRLIKGTENRFEKIRLFSENK